MAMVAGDEGRWWDVPRERPKDDLEEWNRWLAGYQIGFHSQQSDSDETSLGQHATESDGDQVLTPNGERKTSLDFFTEYGYLAAPPRTQRDRWLISRALKRHNLIQYPPTRAFDMHCALAKEFFDVAFSSISLCTDDPDIIQILSPLGAGLENLCTVPFPRSTSLCAHAMLLGDKTAVIRDRSKDWRVRDLSFAPAPTFPTQRQDGFGFYASVPIILSAADYEGEAETRIQVGRLCIIDLEPRPNFDQRDVDRLQKIGQMASADVEKTWLQRRSDLICKSQDLLIEIREAQRNVVEATKRGSASQDDEWRSLLDVICEDSVEACRADGALIIDGGSLTVHDISQQHDVLRTQLSSNHSNDRSSEQQLSEADRSVDHAKIKPERKSVSLCHASAKILNDSASNRERDRADDHIEFLSCYSKDVHYDIHISRQKLEDWLLIKPSDSQLLECRSSTLQTDLDQRFGHASGSIRCPDPIAFELPNTASTYVIATIYSIDGLLKCVFIQYWSGDHALERWEKQYLKHCIQVIEDTCARRRGIQAETIKLTFLQHISHELRTPLHGMAGVLSHFQSTLDGLGAVIGDNGDGSAPIQELVRLCTDASGLQEDLRILVDNLINLSAGVHQDKGEAYYKEVAKNQSGESTLASVERICRQLLLQTCDGSKGNEHVPWIFISKADLARTIDVLAPAPIFCNILTQYLLNAIRATQTAKDRVPIICIKADRDEKAVDMIALSIEDNGIGMRPDILRTFKEPFVKADPHCLGMGIGATIGFTALESIGGRLEADSVHDQGTKITLSFPAHASQTSIPAHLPQDFSSRSARCLFSGSDIDGAVTKHLRPLFTSLNISLQETASFPLSTDEIDFVLMSDTTFLSTTQNVVSPFAHIKHNEVVPIVVLCRRPDSAAGIHAAYSTRPDAADWLHCLCNPIIDSGLDELASFVQNILTTTCTSPTIKTMGPMPRMSLSTDSIHSKELLAQPTLIPSRSITPPNLFSVLIVEDNPLNLRLLTQTMRKAGCKIFAATNGLEAVEEFIKRRPRLILLDVSMPVMDGFEACRLIRKTESESNDQGLTPCRIIALTALSHPADRARGLQVGMNDWRTKPVNLRQIKADVEKWKDCWPGVLLPKKD